MLHTEKRQSGKAHAHFLPVPSALPSPGRHPEARQAHLRITTETGYRREVPFSYRVPLILLSHNKR